MGKLDPYKILVILGAVIGIGLWIYCGVVFEHGLAHFFGVDTQQSQNYDFVSGVGPMIITSFAYTGVFIALTRHLNCHVHGCWRPGKYPMANGQFKVCKPHSAHPDKITHEYVLEEHAKCSAPPS